MRFLFTSTVAAVLALALFALPGQTVSTAYAVPSDNVCGNSAIDVPDSGNTFNFSEPCAIHDKCYAQGGTERDRRSCDQAFLDAMLASCAAGERWKRLGCGTVAYTYYLGVRLGGWAFFPYGSQDPS